MPVPTIGAEQLTVFLLQAGLLLLAALALGRLAVRLGMPAITGELCAGVLAGPSVLARVAPAASNWLLPPQASQAHLLDAVGQVGVVLLTGLTGMQVDLGLVRRRGGQAARIGAAGLLVPLALGVGIGLILPASFLPEHGGRGVFALFLGVALGVSALPVIARILTDLRLLHRDMGQLILCAVTVDDVAGWLLLAVVSAFATSKTGTGARSLALPFAGLLVTVAAAVAARPVLRVLLRRADGDGTVIALVTALALLSAAATQAVRLEAVIGAFACGLMIRSSGAIDPARLAPLSTVVMTVLAPLYFATAGLRMNLVALASPGPLLAGIVVLAAAIFGKFAGAYAGGRACRLTRWESLAVGAGINSRGVVEVIVAMTGLQLGVLSQDMYTIVVLVAIVTSLMAPPLLRSWMGRVECSAQELLRADLTYPELAAGRPPGAS